MIELIFPVITYPNKLNTAKNTIIYNTFLFSNNFDMVLGNFIIYIRCFKKIDNNINILFVLLIECLFV